MSPSAERFHLAQLNIGLPREPLESELLADFVAALEPVNAAADASPGFVWRLQTEEGDATSIRVYDDERLIVNFSVWESIEALRAFVYASPTHKAPLRRRHEWFEKMDFPFVLWWVLAGYIPSIEEAQDRLELLRRNGPSAEAFTFRVAFEPTPAGAVQPTRG